MYYVSQIKFNNMKNIHLIQKKTSKLLFTILLLCGINELWAIASPIPPNMIYLRDRKWDVRQIYVNQMPVDSHQVADLAISFAFMPDDNKCYYFVQNDSLGEQIGVEMSYSTVENIQGDNYIIVHESSNPSAVWYNFHIEHISKDHLVLKFTQISADDSDPTPVKTIEYRFVADNSIYY